MSAAGGAHLNLSAVQLGSGRATRAGRGPESPPRGRGLGAGGAERGCGCVWVGPNDVKQSGAPWRLGTITFNYNNWCLSAAFAFPRGISRSVSLFLRLALSLSGPIRPPWSATPSLALPSLHLLFPDVLPAGGGGWGRRLGAWGVGGCCLEPIRISH